MQLGTSMAIKDLSLFGRGWIDHKLYYRPASVEHRFKRTVGLVYEHLNRLRFPGRNDGFNERPGTAIGTKLRPANKPMMPHNQFKNVILGLSIVRVMKGLNRD